MVRVDLELTWDTGNFPLRPTKMTKMTKSLFWYGGGEGAECLTLTGDVAGFDLLSDSKSRP